MRIAGGFNADLPVSDVVKYAKEAEVLGFDSLWMHEHSFGRDAISYLGPMAKETSKVKIGVACLSPYVRHPVLLAMTMATVQESSKGRAILGLGTGFPMRLDLMGIKHDKPIAAMKETIEICRGLWSGSSLSYSGKVFALKDVRALPGKVESKIPIYVAGWKRQMLAVTGKYADGYVAKGGESVTSISHIVEEIDSNAERSGRSALDIDIAAYLLTMVGKTKEEAIIRARKDPFVVYMLSVQDDYLYEGTGIDPAKKRPIAENYFRGNLSEASSRIEDEMIEAFTLVGTKQDVAQRIIDYRKAGVGLPILQPISVEKHEDVANVLAAGKILIESY